jgi:hypothetical protein
MSAPLLDIEVLHRKQMELSAKLQMQLNTPIELCGMLEKGM